MTSKRVGEYKVRSRKTNRALYITARKEGSPTSYSLVVPLDIVGSASDMIDAVLTEKEEANG